MFYMKNRVATFAAGCFWGVEEEFLKCEGVIFTEVGYMGGRMKDPEYEDVMTDTTGHAEVVQVTYDEEKLSYEKLLVAFFSLHNPSTIPGTKYKYRSTIFYHTTQQKQSAENILEEIKSLGIYDYKVKTTIVNAEKFYRGEEYHQRYYAKMKRS